MGSEKDKEYIEISVGLKTWLQLIFALIAAGFLLVLLGSFIMPLIWRLGLGVD